MSECSVVHSLAGGRGGAGGGKPSEGGDSGGSRLGLLQVDTNRQTFQGCLYSGEGLARQRTWYGAL